MTPRATRYSIGVYDRMTGERPVEVEETDHEKDTWAIRDGRYALNHDMDWEYEPLPSNRDEAFLARCRWPLSEALPAATQAHEEMMAELRCSAERMAKRSV